MNIQLQEEKVIQEAKQDIIVLKDNSRIRVNSLPSLTQANEQLGELKRIKKILGEKKDSILKPLNEAVKNLRALFKPLEDDVELVEKFLKSEILNYNAKLLKEKEEREKEAMKKLDEGEQIDKVIKKVENTNERLNQIKTRKIKKLKIVDINLIPREYMIPNEVLIREDLLEGKKVFGCEIIEEEIAIL